MTTLRCRAFGELASLTSCLCVILAFGCSSSTQEGDAGRAAQVAESVGGSTRPLEIGQRWSLELPPSIHGPFGDSLLIADLRPHEACREELALVQVPCSFYGQSFGGPRWCQLWITQSALQRSIRNQVGTGAPSSQHLVPLDAEKALSQSTCEVLREPLEEALEAWLKSWREAMSGQRE